MGGNENTPTRETDRQPVTSCSTTVETTSSTNHGGSGQHIWRHENQPAAVNTFGAMRTILVVPGSRITICHPEENVIGLHSPMWPEVPHHRDICHGHKRTLYLSALGVSFWLWMLVACFNTSLPAHFALLLPLQRMDGPN